VAVSRHHDVITVAGAVPEWSRGRTGFPFNPSETGTTKGGQVRGSGGWRQGKINGHGPSGLMPIPYGVGSVEQWVRWAKAYRAVPIKARSGPPRGKGDSAQQFLSDEEITQHAREGRDEDDLQHNAGARDIVADASEGITDQGFHMVMSPDVLAPCWGWYLLPLQGLPEPEILSEPRLRSGECKG